ncbi:MAG: S41 family peptidase [Pseudanabaenales cyanobacterium]|nr:S41 family peptidase [Pseudanabaenales cyanobacterium]
MSRNHIVRPKRYKSQLIGLTLAVLMGLVYWSLNGLAPSASLANAELFDAVWETINENFYDPNFNGVDWAALGAQYRSQVREASSPAEKAALINEMLAPLQTSHTHLYTADTPAYYQILGIFYPRSSELQAQLQDFFSEGKIEYVGIGIVTHDIDGQTFVKAVFDGSPAAAAGLQAGDQILSVAGQPFQPIQSFADQVDQPVTLQIQTSANPDSQQEITVTPKRFDGATMFLDAMTDSVQVVNKAGRQIGYIHIWSYAGEQYQQKLEEELFYGRLKDVDALVLDFRDGWGGAPPNPLHIFTARGPSVTTITRSGQVYTSKSQWEKPVVMLVNEGSRSAKEILAYAFQHYDIGPVVGSPTAGAVVAGGPFIMPDNSVLYVAMADVYVDETVRLEGKGVTPDVVVPSPIAYAQGADPQKEQAISTALEMLNS